MTIFNYIFDNNVVFYSILCCTTGFIGYSFVTSYLNSNYISEGVQTDAWEDYSERPSQIGFDSITSIDTVTPRFSPVEYINTGVQSIDTSTVTTILPVPPVNIEVVPNPDILGKVSNHADIILSCSDIGNRTQQILDMLTLWG